MARVKTLAAGLGLLTACAHVPRGDDVVQSQRCDASARWQVPAGETRALRVWLEVPSQASPEWRFDRVRRLDFALASWNRIQLPVRLTPASSFLRSDIVVLVVDRLPPGDASLQVNHAGVTSLTWGDAGEIAKARVFVAERTPNGDPYSSDEQLGTLLHELGHAMGLPHSTNQFALMAPQPVVSLPTPVDVRQARAWYEGVARCEAPAVATLRPALPQ